MARVLIAEDEPAVRAFGTRALVQRGGAVTAVRDGGEALDVLREESFDLLPADMIMPRLDGVGPALKIATAYPDLRVVPMTGYAAERDRAHNLGSLVHRVVGKPFSLLETRETATRR